MSERILTGVHPFNDYRSYLKHSDDDEQKYGLPDKKKYPMPDRDHVLSAIKFFNYVSPADEKELAKNILARIREYEITDINVGDNNRFRKYYNADHLEHHGMNDLYPYPQNDYRNYLQHWGKGKQAKDHKYISREKGKNGKWIYTYASKLKNKVQEVADKVTGKGEEVVAEPAGTETTKSNNLLDIFSSLTNKKQTTSTNTNKQNKFSALATKLKSTLSKPLSSTKPKKSLDSVLKSLSKSKKKVSDALKKSISSAKSSNAMKSTKKSLNKLNSKLSKALSKPANAVKNSKIGTKLKNSKSKKVGANPDDTRAPHDPSMDHSKSDKTELVSYLAKLGIHKLTMNYPKLARDAIRAAKFTEAPIRKKMVENSRAKSTERDKESGLLLKHSEMSKKEDMAMINPEFKNFDANTKNNCMLCTTAYDLRRRGYDVSANKASWGYDAPDATRWYKNAKVEDAAQLTSLDQVSMNRYMNETIKQLEAQGEGARGNLMVQWTVGGGHSMAYEIENGKVVIYDCQSNTVYRNPEVILQNTWKSQYMRTDNLEVDFDYVREAVNDNSSSSNKKRR